MNNDTDDSFVIHRVREHQGIPFTRNAWQQVLFDNDDDEPLYPRDSNILKFIVAMPRPDNIEVATTAPFRVRDAVSDILDAELQQTGTTVRWEAIARAFWSLVSRDGSQYAARVSSFTFSTERALAFVLVTKNFVQNAISVRVSVMQFIRVPPRSGIAKYGRLHVVGLRWRHIEYTNYAILPSSGHIHGATERVSSRRVTSEPIMTRNSYHNYLTLINENLQTYIYVPHFVHEAANYTSLLDTHIEDACWSSTTAMSAVFPYVYAEANFDEIGARVPPLTWLTSDALARMHRDEYVHCFAESLVVAELPPSLRFTYIGRTFFPRNPETKRIDTRWHAISFLVTQLAFIYARGYVPDHLRGSAANYIVGQANALLYPNNDDDVMLDDDDDDDANYRTPSPRTPVT